MVLIIVVSVGIVIEAILINEPRILGNVPFTPFCPVLDAGVGGYRRGINPEVLHGCVSPKDAVRDRALAMSQPAAIAGVVVGNGAVMDRGASLISKCPTAGSAAPISAAIPDGESPEDTRFVLRARPTD